MLHRQGNAFCAARRASGVEALEPRRLLSGAIPSVPGDANLDGTVNFADLIKLAQNYGRSGAAWAQGDFDGDGTVAFADLITLAQNYGRDTTTPYLARISVDPSSLVLASGTRFRFGAKIGRAHV